MECDPNNSGSMEKRKSMYTRDYKKLGFIVSQGASSGGLKGSAVAPGCPGEPKRPCVSVASHSAPQNHVNPAVDFTQIPPGMLALDNMLYFARHHQDAYIRVSPPPETSPPP